MYCEVELRIDELQSHMNTSESIASEHKINKREQTNTKTTRFHSIE